MVIPLTGCTKYEKDKSYNTDLYGSYSEYVEASNVSYSRNESYTLDEDDTYNHIYKEINNGIVSNDSNTDGKILSIEEISDDIIQITLDREITNLSTGETSNETVYKYKNILGEFYEAEVPKDKTFSLFLKNQGSTLNEGNVFDEKGSYHYCTNYNNCTCDKDGFIHYKRKDNIIFFQSMDEEHKDCYSVDIYIVDDGLFFPELYKEK